MIQAAIAPSGTELWAFGDPVTAGQAGYVAHFTGKTWIRGSFPLSGTAAAASSPADVWVGGNTSTGEPGIEHWNGHQWQGMPLPSLGIGHPGMLDLVDVTGIAIVKPDDVWADVSSIGSGSAQLGLFLFHWNGKTWARAAFPYAGTTIAPVTSDGNGGLWLVLQAGANNKLWFCHYSAGHWTRTPGPSGPGGQPDVSNLSWIPGTHSQWALGSVDSVDVGTAILKYGT